MPPSQEDNSAYSIALIAYLWWHYYPWFFSKCSSCHPMIGSSHNLSL